MVRGLNIAVISLVFVALSHVGSAQIQVQEGFKTAPLGKDTLCFSYRFMPNDTIVYHVDASDSISFLGDPIILRIRSEYIQIICDSVTSDQVSHLRLRMLSYAEKSTTGRDSSSRTSHPWVGRVIRLGLDSLGRRVYSYNEQASKAAIAPGGAFQLLLLPPLDTACGRQNQSWFYEDTMALVENGVPYPIMHVGYLWRVLDKADTLGKTFSQIQYTLSGIGRLVLTDEEASFDLQCQSAGYGKLSFDPVYGLPYAIFATVENKLTLNLANGAVKKGQHKTMQHVFLHEIRRRNKP